MNSELSAGLSETLGEAMEDPGTPGELLRTARGQRGLSIQQAAEDLHLDVRLVEAIESNRFIELGAPVYARGHLRKYATLLGLSPELVLERYQMLSDTPVVPTPVPAVSAIPERPRMSVPLGILAVTLLAAGAWWAFEQYEAGVQAPVSVPAARLPALQEDSPQPGVQPSAASAAAALPADDAAAVDAIPASAEQVPPAASPGSAVRLRLEFTDASWVEVYDGRGGRLLFEVGQPGEQRTVSGSAPLQVVLGVANAVTAHVNDQPIVVPRVAGRDATRFLIEDDGKVR